MEVEHVLEPLLHLLEKQVHLVAAGRSWVTAETGEVWWRHQLVNRFCSIVAEQVRLTLVTITENYG